MALTRTTILASCLFVLGFIFAFAGWANTDSYRTYAQAPVVLGEVTSRTSNTLEITYTALDGKVHSAPSAFVTEELLAELVVGDVVEVAYWPETPSNVALRTAVPAPQLPIGYWIAVGLFFLSCPALIFWEYRLKPKPPQENAPFIRYALQTTRRRSAGLALMISLIGLFFIAIPFIDNQGFEQAFWGTLACLGTLGILCLLMAWVQIAPLRQWDLAEIEHLILHQPERILSARRKVTHTRESRRAPQFGHWEVHLTLDDGREIPLPLAAPDAVRFMQYMDDIEP